MKFYYCPICHKRFGEIVYQEIKKSALCYCGIPVVYFIEEENHEK